MADNTRTPTAQPQPGTPVARPLLTIKGEYRFAKTDSMKFPARDGRPERVVNRAIHTIEVDARSLELSEELAPGVDVTTWATPVKKGTPVEIGLHVEPANVMSIVNGRPQATRGLWRIRVLSITPLP